MPGYKHPCPYCDRYIESSVAACPFCGVTDPFTRGRCPDCRHALEPGWTTCPGCGRAIGATPATMGSSPTPAEPAVPTPPNAVSPAPAEVARCAACGAALEPGARFCATCGTVVS